VWGRGRARGITAQGLPVRILVCHAWYFGILTAAVGRL
jgi:hypothetical protein